MRKIHDIQNTVKIRVEMSWRIIKKLLVLLTAIFLVAGYRDGLSSST